MAKEKSEAKRNFKLSEGGIISIALKKAKNSGSGRFTPEQVRFLENRLKELNYKPKTAKRKDEFFNKLFEENGLL